MPITSVDCSEKLGGAWACIKQFWSLNGQSFLYQGRSHQI